MIKKIILALFVGILLAMPVWAASDYGLKKTGGALGYNTNSTVTIQSTFLSWLKTALGFTSIIFLGFTLYSGLRWLTARGKEDLITRAKESLEGAIMGLVIISLAYAITNFVLGAMGVAVPKGDSNSPGSCSYMYRETDGTDSQQCETGIVNADCIKKCANNPLHPDEPVNYSSCRWDPKPDQCVP